MKKETFHVISNTHWDREWYQCHEKFLVRLVELMDRLLDIMDAHTDYRFVTDGQFALVEDYLRARPEYIDRVKKLVSENRLLIGPWYTQPLENIVGGEALVRNLQKGIKESEKLGGAMRFSYEIDEFGHTSQLPQILAGFDIHGVMAWRGVPYKCKSYFRWEGTDGTVADFFNSNAGYGEATALPSEIDDYTEVIDGITHEREGLVSHVKRIRELRLHVSDSTNMLWLNGIDHSWAQEDILEICEKVEALFPDYEVKQSTPDEYADAVISDLKARNIEPETVRGELMFTSEPVLESTNSLHTRQKIRHYESEKLLVRQVEPLAAAAFVLGGKYPDWGIERAWKYVLENHAHDSLGCSSVDEVFEQVMARYGASISLSEQLNENSLRYIMSCGEQTPSLWLFNLCEEPVRGATKVTFDVPVGFGGENIKLETPDGKPVGMSVLSKETLGDVRYNPRLGHPTWGNVTHYEVIIDAPVVPAFGAQRLCIKQFSPADDFRNRQDSFFVTRPGTLENKYIKAEIKGNGTFTLTDKRNGRSYPDQLTFTDDGEAGHCYVHEEPVNDARRFTSLGCNAQVNTLFDTPLGAACEIIVKMQIPTGITPDRKRRTDLLDEVKIRSVITLLADSDKLAIDIDIDNKCRNHRLRALFPSYIAEARVSESGQAYDEVERSIVIPDRDDLNERPYVTHPMQDYCAVHGDGCGLGVSARGIYEYECTDDAQHALALTLLRAIEVIDNDTFEETPAYFMHEAQNLCEVKHSLCLIPYSGKREELLGKVKSALMPVLAVVNRTPEVSVMPDYRRPQNIIGDSFKAVELAGEGLEITAFTRAENSDGIIVRVRNRTASPVTGTITVTMPGFAGKSVFLSNFGETVRDKVASGRSVTRTIGAGKVETFIFE